MIIQSLAEAILDAPETTLGIILDNDIFTLENTISILDRTGNRCFITDWKVGEDETVSYTRKWLMNKNDIEIVVAENFRNFINNHVSDISKMVRNNTIKDALNIGTIRSGIISTIINKIGLTYYRESTLVASLIRVFYNSFNMADDLEIFNTYLIFLKNKPTPLEKELFKMMVKEDASVFSLWHLYVDRTDMSIELKYLLWLITIFKTWKQEHYISQFKMHTAGDLTIFKNKAIKLMEECNEV